MFWETCIFKNLFAMIIHLYYDIHHLKEGGGFGSVLGKIVYSRQVYIEVGISRASLAQFSMFFVRDSVWRLVAKTFVRLFACNLELLTVWSNSQCDQPQPVELLASCITDLTNKSGSLYIYNRNCPRHNQLVAQVVMTKQNATCFPPSAVLKHAHGLSVSWSSPTLLRNFLRLVLQDPTEHQLTYK